MDLEDMKHRFEIPIPMIHDGILLNPILRACAGKAAFSIPIWKAVVC